MHNNVKVRQLKGAGADCAPDQIPATGPCSSEVHCTLHFGLRGNASRKSPSVELVVEFPPSVRTP